MSEPPATRGPRVDSAPTPSERSPDSSGPPAREEPRPTEVGERLGPHVVVARLGQGGMGEVLLVRDEPLGREVAAKALRRGCDDRRQVDAFVREARLTGRLDHPGIVPVHAFGRAEDGRPFFTMKRVQGETLADVGPRWTLVRRLEAFLKVCDAVAFAHDRGVIHRDLKPHNVMVGQFGEVVVLDWGLGRALDEEDAHESLRASPATHALGARAADGQASVTRLALRDESLRASPATHPLGARAADGQASVTRLALREGEGASDGDSSASDDGDGPSPTEVVAMGTRKGAVAGTPAYMAPEQARGEADLDARTDVFGLGAIFYELLTGRAPWAAPRAEASLARALRGDLTAPRELAPDVPWELEAVALRALARRREERYEGALALREDVLSFLEGRLLRAARYGRLQRLGRWARARRGPLVGAALALALAALGGGVAVRAWLDGRAFDADAAEAREAAAAGRHDQAIEAAGRALALRESPDLAALAAGSREARRLEVEEKARALDEAARFRRVQEAMRPVTRLVDEVRPLRHVAHVDLRARLVEVEAALGDLERLLLEPGLRYAEPWAVLGAGWSLCARAGRARASLRRAHELAPEDGAVRVDLARLELEHALVATLGFQERQASAPLEPPSFQAAGAAATEARALLDHPSVEVRGRGRPGSLDAARIAALTAFAAQDRATMARVCREGLARNKGELEVADLWILLAVAVGVQDGGAAEHRDALDRALALRPHDPWAPTLRAMVRAQQGDTAGALVDLDRVLAVYPRHGLAALQRGALRALADPASGLLDLDVACEELPDVPVAWLNRGLARQRCGRHAEARDDLARAAELGAGPAAWRGLSWANASLGRRAEAAVAAGEAVALRQDDGALREWLELLQGDAAAVESAVGHALRLRPGWPYALVQRAGLHHAAGDAARMTADLEVAAAAEARTADELVVRGAALTGLQRHDAALAALDRAVILAPGDPGPLRMRAHLHAELGRADHAIVDLEEAATRVTLTGADRAVLAEMRLRRGQNAQALEDARAAVALSPGHGLAHLALGKAYGVTGDFAAARAPLERAVELLPRHAIAHLNLGTVLLQLGEPEAGRAHFERACDLDPRGWQGWFNLAACCAAMGDREPAKEAVRKALDLAPPARRAQVERLARTIEELPR